MLTKFKLALPLITVLAGCASQQSIPAPQEEASHELTTKEISLVGGGIETEWAQVMEVEKWCPKGIEISTSYVANSRKIQAMVDCKTNNPTPMIAFDLDKHYKSDWYFLEGKAKVIISDPGKEEAKLVYSTTNQKEELSNLAVMAKSGQLIAGFYHNYLKAIKSGALSIDSTAHPVNVKEVTVHE